MADLELDLEVFSGPFDLLLTLVLREEVDLMEVELADVVLAYIDVLDARGDLDLETATEFLVLVAALLELKSRLLLPSEADDLLDLEPHEAAEELLARLLDAHRYRNAADHLSELSSASPGTATAGRRCRARCGAPIPRPRAPSTSRRSSGRRSAGCCASPRSSTCATSTCPRSRWPSGSSTCVRCCAAVAAPSTMPCGARIA